MSKCKYRVLINGDSAVTVEFGNEISEEINNLVMALANKIQQKNINGIVEIIPTFRSLTICYNPIIINFDNIIKQINKLCKNLKSIADNNKTIIKIPVCYGGKFGEDLLAMSEILGLSEDEIIKKHCSGVYRIYMLGFLPGFAYLGGLDQSLFCPRLENPRLVIPKGSVGIGGEQTGIYPISSPGGWRLIGRTPINPYDNNRLNPFLYQAGDYISFYQISENEFDEISQNDNFKCETVEVNNEH